VYLFPKFPFARKRSPDGATLTEVTDIQLQLTTHLSTPRDERLSWPGWLTYSGRFTHINGHPSATGRAQDRESSPATDRHSTVVPRNQQTRVKRLLPPTCAGDNYLNDRRLFIVTSVCADAV